MQANELDNSIGNVLVALGDLFTVRNDKKAAEQYYAKALSVYKTSVQLVTDNVLKTKILTNIVQAMAKNDNHANVEFNQVWQQVQDLPDSHDKAFALMTLAKFIAPKQKLLAHEILMATIQVADVVQDKRSIAYAKGHLAGLSISDNYFITFIFLEIVLSKNYKRLSKFIFILPRLAIQIYLERWFIPNPT